MEVVSGSALQSEAYKAPILWPENYKEEDRKPMEPESTMEIADRGLIMKANQ